MSCRTDAICHIKPISAVVAANCNSDQPCFLVSSVSFGCCRFRGPIAVSELMHFFDATHESINDSSRADRLDSASFGRPIKRVRTEAATVPPTASTPQAQTQNAQQSQVKTALLTLPPSGKCCLDKVACSRNTWCWIMTNDYMWRMTAGSGHPCCVDKPRWVCNSLQGHANDPAPKSILCIRSKEITRLGYPQIFV